MSSGSNPAVRRPSALIGLLALVLMSGCAHKPLVTENKGRELKNEGPVIADTASGQMQGVLSEGIRVFKGIPYGGPTSGKNRFMPPVKPESWSGVRDALEYGPRCAQRSAIGTGVAREVIAALITPDTQAMSEDCLAVNVWTPGVGDGRKRPVMVCCSSASRPGSRMIRGVRSACSGRASSRSSRDGAHRPSRNS